MNIKRQESSGAIINTDREALNKYKMERKYQKKVVALESQVAELQAAIARIHERIDYLEQE